MNTSLLKTRLIKEINLVPENRLSELYKIIRSFRTETEFTDETNDTPLYHDLDHLFGKWSEEEFRQIQGKIDSERKIDEDMWK